MLTQPPCLMRLAPISATAMPTCIRIASGTWALSDQVLARSPSNSSSASGYALVVRTRESESVIEGDVRRVKGLEYPVEVGQLQHRGNLVAGFGDPQVTARLPGRLQTGDQRTEA